MSDRIAHRPTDAERRGDAAELARLHIGNRFRLMMGVSLLPQPEYDAMTPEQRRAHDRKIVEKNLDESNGCGNTVSHMNSDEAIIESKSIRQQADTLLQRIKAFKENLKILGVEPGVDQGEAIAQCTLSQRDLESTIMRQGMVLKAVGRANPYPESYNPENTKVEPTADGLTL